jgi:NAD(P)-dependent dehydrogenase (short-subunit alcohol dehydrogenase family)
MLAKSGPLPEPSGKKGLKTMADKRVWFITGAGRGMGVDIAQAALAAGHAVVATGRNTEAVADAIGEADDVLVVALDITSLASAEAAVQAAVDRDGTVNLFGPVRVT